MAGLSSPARPPIAATVTRTLLGRWRVGQLLAPIGVGVGVVARRLQSPSLMVVTGVMYLATAVAFLSARRTFRRVEVRTAARALSLVLNGAVVELRDVSCWTFDGGRARVYDGQGGWSLRGGDADAIRAALTHALGAPLTVKRRGSKRARVTSLIVACLGVPVLVAGAVHDIIALALVGLLTFLFGLGVFGTLSQKVSFRPGSAG
jgi:hypothetical protein